METNLNQLVAARRTDLSRTAGGSIDGRFEYDEQELSLLYDTKGIYPFGLSSSGLDVDVFKLWFVWAKNRERVFAPEALPWVPVGRVGPILILGHCQPDKAEVPILPEGLFQPVLLTAQAYNQQLRALSQLYTGATEKNYLGIEFVEPTTWPERQKISTVTEAVRYILRSLIYERSELSLLTRFAEKSTLKLEDLPPGYRSAVWFLLRRGPVVDLTCLRSPGDMVKLIPEPLRSRVTPIYHLGKLAVFATSEGENSQIEDMMHASLPGEGWRLRFAIHDTARERGSGDSTGEDGAKVFVGGNKPGDEKAEVTLVVEAKTYDKFDPRASKAQATDVFYWLLNYCLKDDISDLHIEPGLVQARARVRRDGNLVEILGMTDPFCRTLVASAKSMIGMRSELYDTQDGHFSVRRGDLIVNVRVSALPIRKAYQGLVLRFLPRRSRTVQLENLDQPTRTVSLIKHAIKQPQGLILTCGPTGSGKTTTLYACLGILNTTDRKIVTAEDPIEYEVEGIMQAGVDKLRGVTFDRLVEAFLRQDPDVCLIGEIRNKETAEIALQLALTGHLVFATLHTLSSSKSIRRLLDLGVNPAVLSEALLLVQSQRLAQRLCPKCRVSVDLTKPELEIFEKHGVPVATRMRYVPNPTGCNHCRESGYSGRIAVMDLLPITNEIKEIIISGGRSTEIDTVAKHRGFPDLVQEALKHVIEGNITLEEALVHQDPWSILEDKNV